MTVRVHVQVRNRGRVRGRAIVAGRGLVGPHATDRSPPTLSPNMFVHESSGELAELPGTDPLILLWQHGRSRHLLRQQAPVDPRVTGLVFHMSRCGSTLLARIAAEDPNVLVLNEPELLNQVLRRDEATPGLYRDAVAALISEYMPSAQRVVIKTSSWHAHQCPLLLEAFPAARRVLLKRDLKDVLDSIVARPPAWALNRLGPNRRPSGEPEVDARFIGRVTGEVVQGLATVSECLLSDPSNWLVMHYHDLLTEPQRAARWLGAEVSQEEARQVMRWHSKTGERWER